jgi:hypothetical protein
LLITHGLAALDRAEGLGGTGSYVIQAQIAACHARAPCGLCESTDCADQTLPPAGSPYCDHRRGRLQPEVHLRGGGGLAGAAYLQHPRGRRAITLRPGRLRRADVGQRSPSARRPDLRGT